MASLPSNYRPFQTRFLMLDVSRMLSNGILHMEPSQPVECDSKPLDVQFAFE